MSDELTAVEKLHNAMCDDGLKNRKRINRNLLRALTVLAELRYSIIIPEDQGELYHTESDEEIEPMIEELMELLSESSLLAANYKTLFCHQHS